MTARPRPLPSAPIAAPRRRWRLAWAACLTVAIGGFSAHATRIALAAERNAEARAHAAVPHTPPPLVLASATASADPLAAPARGTTGTTVLPDLPVPAGADRFASDAAVWAARPFSLAGAPPLARSRALQCLATAIYYEAASESELGQRAVAQVILNRTRHTAFPNSVCGVVYQGSEKAGCQFSFACDGSMARIPSATGMARATRYAADALNGYVVGAVGTATHYHTYAVTPAWNRTLVMTAVIGAHLFHRWKGYWGTPAAFGQRYAAAEPMPGPKPRLAATQLAAASIALRPVPAVDTAQAAYSDSGRPLDAAAPAAATTAPNAKTGSAALALPESTILDRWQGTGQPLR